MYSNVVMSRQWSRLANVCRSLSSIEGQKLPQTSTSSDGISPPPRKPRGPTDILQALAATVGNDPTAAHYKYHDDPFLIPLSNFRKRSYALSAEAGRKAAAWIRDEHADLFTIREWDPPMKKKEPYFNADPKIPAFAPKPIYNDESKVTEDDLKYTIEKALLEDAIKVFELLGGEAGISDELKLSFLQLLCFYNEKEPISMEWLEERWFSAATKERHAATWKLGGLADKIFAAMDPKTPEAYCAIIQGMAKYFQAERAHALAQEAKENGIPLSTNVYNALLGCVGFLKEGVTMRIDALKSLLLEMNEQGLSPNSETLNACLKSLSAWGSGKMLQTVALQIVADFKQIGIEPSLSAYYYLLCLFCKEQGPKIDILTSIITDLEKRESLKPTDAADTNFFITAMGVCSNHLQDINLAERLHKLLMKDDNYKLVGDAYKESIYYRHFVTVACRYAPFERTTELLDMLVPNVYVPEPSVMEEIIKTLEVAGAGERLAAAWSQLVVFGLASRARLVERLLAALVQCCDLQDEDVQEKIRGVAADILKFEQMLQEREDNNDSRTPVQKLSATALSHVIQLCCSGAGAWAEAAAALRRLRDQRTTGAPAPAPLALLAARAAAAGDHALAAMAVTYLAECGFEEAVTASVETLGLILNRSKEEVEKLLEENKPSLATSLQPSALEIVRAYHACRHVGCQMFMGSLKNLSQFDSRLKEEAKTGALLQESGSSTSSDSDNESSSDDN